jgi:DNA-binding transcriptional MerR regulator/effector-binding domain-containing protein
MKSIGDGHMDENTLLSIKDFSRFTGISQSALRYYDEIGLLPPAKRGENNYRYYVPFQIITLKFIEVFTELGVPLSVIKEMNRSRTPQSILGLLNRQEAVLDRRFNELRTLYSIIHTYNRNIEDGLMAGEKEMSVRYFEENVGLLGRPNDYTNGRTYFDEFITFVETAKENRINLRFPIGGYYNDMQSFTESIGKPDRFVSQDPMGNTVFPAGNYMVAFDRGYYEMTGDLPNRMAAFAEELNLEFIGPVLSMFIIDEICMPDEKNYISRSMVAVREKRK